MNSSEMLSAVVETKKQSHDDVISAKKKEYDQLKNDLIRSKRAIKVLTGEDAQKVRFLIYIYLNVKLIMFFR